MSTKTAQVESLLWLKQLPGFLLFCCSELFKQGLSYLAHNLAWHSDLVSSTFLSQDRRKLTPLVIVKEILQKTKLGYGPFGATLNLWIRQWSEWDALAFMEIIFLLVLILKLNEGTKGKCGVR